MNRENKNKLSHFAAQFPVPNVIEAAEWYRDNLGFDFTFQWGDPPDYAVTSRDSAVAIHFVKAEENKEVQPRVLYIFCYDVDEIHKELSTKKIANITTPHNHEYGMRDFELIDPCGHRLVFGTGYE